MKVLKFGGTSVGTIEALHILKQIVDDAKQQSSLIIVVSALGGVTDQLIRTAHMAEQGNTAWEQEYEQMLQRHLDMAQQIASADSHLTRDIESLLHELHTIYYGVSLIRDLSTKTLDTIVSYGERCSSIIVRDLLEAQWLDSRSLIKTERRNGRNELASDESYRLIEGEMAKWLNGREGEVIVMPGFIASDKTTGETTTLGRGGSDYTAAIVAAALKAECLEIWTDVSGFMTADPRVINTAYAIPQLTYNEASELCNFGAKVVYPPTIYPVCRQGIPIYIKNTFRPDDPGSVIQLHVESDNKPIKGISSVRGVALLTVSGQWMMGVIGTNQRIFATLAQLGMSVFMVSEASSEQSISIGLKDSDVDKAAEALNQEFKEEIRTGAMLPMQIEKGLATVAIVGENMKRRPGVAGKLFSTLGRSGISVVSFAQGATETNISFMVSEAQLSKTLNVIHEAFFLSEYKELNIFVCGTGTVGGKLLQQIAAQQKTLKEQNRLVLNVVGIAGSKRAIYNAEGLDLSTYRDQLNAASNDSNTTRLKERILEMNLHNSVFVDCTASADVAALYKTLLEHNVSVVAANKIAASGPYADYARLKHLALTRGVKYLFETNVGAGLPIISTINDICHSGDKILRIDAVLSGTLNYIFNTLSAEVPFSETVRLAKEEGYSEPDPRIDLSGTDVARKILILAREAGYAIEASDVEKRLFLPQALFDGTEEQFWQALPTLDAEFETRRQQLAQQGKCLRYVATLDNGKASVGLRELSISHPFAKLTGSNNIVMLTTERYHESPMIIQGYGAGTDVTAAGVFANIMSVANVW